MIFRYLLFFISTILLPLAVVGQTESLREIIGSNIESEVKQYKLDSLFSYLILNNDKNVLAENYHDLGSKWYYKKWKDEGRKDSHTLSLAIKATRQSISLKEQLRPVNVASLKKSLYNLGVFENFQGNPFKAIEAYNKLIGLGKEDKRTQNANREIAYLYEKIGDYQKAVERFKNCVTYYSNNNESSIRLIKSHIYLADIYATMGYTAFTSDIIQNLHIADSLLIINNIRKPLVEAEISQIHGNLSIELGDYVRALNNFNNVLSAKKSFSNRNLARVYNSIGVCYQKLKHQQESLHYLNNAIELDSLYSSPYENLGDFYIEQNQFSRGMQYYQQAIELVTGQKGYTQDIKRLPDAETLALTSDKLSLLNHLTTKANAWLTYYEHDNDKAHLEAAMATFETADQLIDIIRAYSSEFRSKLYWREQSAKLYGKAVEACYLLNRSEKAFYFMERNKALLLLEDITHEKAKALSQLPDSIAKQDFTLKRTIALTESALKNTESANEKLTQTLRDSIFKVKRRYHLFLEEITKTYPKYAQYRKQLPIIDHVTFRNHYVTNDDIVVHYLLGEDQAYGLLTAEDGSELFKVGGENFKEDLSKMIKLIREYNYSSNLSYFDVSQAVFNALFPKDMLSKLKGKNVLVIPDGALQQLPLEALLISQSPERYLIEEATIRYAYSISLLEQMASLMYDTPDQFSAFAPVDFTRLGLNSLPNSSSEASDATSLMKGNLFENASATTEEFTQQLDKNRILHLSTHADMGDNDNHWIAFADKKFFMDEVYAYKTQADMVVLSACNTSVGEIQQGEGVMSLARGFFNAGTKSVVSTLWTVDDTSSKDIVVNFYEQLNKGHSKSEALHNAKLEYLKTTQEPELKHPYYWAGFVLIGDNSPIASSTPWWYWALGIVFAFCVLGSLYKRRSV